MSPLLAAVCEALRREREHEIRRLAEHSVQMQNELSAYQHAASPFEEMLRKHTGYRDAAPYRRVQTDVRRLLASLSEQIKPKDNDRNSEKRLSDTPLRPAR